MYQEYFGFKAPPFSIAPDPRYLYMSERHREALAHLLYGIKGDGGFVLLTGEVGTGKTTVCRCLLEQVPENTDVAFILNPKVTVNELLATICDEFHINYPEGNYSIKVFIDHLNKFLLDAHAKDRHSVLILDEAQNLSGPVLEQLRLLTNLETNERKLLQIILLGQPELKDILARPEIRQIGQRVTARYHLEPLSAREVKAYVSHRLMVAGVARTLFPPSVIRKLYRHTGGVPRLINVICDRALLGTFVQGLDRVTKKTLSKAVKEVFGEDKERARTLRRYRWAMAGLAIFISGAVLAAYYHQQPEPDLVITAAIVGDKEKKVAFALQESPLESNAMYHQDEEAEEMVQETKSTGQLVLTNEAISQEIPSSIPQGIKSKPLPDNSQAETGGQQVLQTLEWTLGIPIAESWAKSYQALFKRWGILYDPDSGGAVCQFALAQGLRCLGLQGSLASLLHYNRPAVLTLYTEEGQHYYAAMTDYIGETAMFALGGETREVPLTDVVKRWKGEFALLWSVPSGYSDSLDPGGKGRVVKWLDQKLALLEGRPYKEGKNVVFTEDMVNQVKKFQFAKNLVPDGIVGPQTIIHLNTEVGTGVPLLTQKQKED